jgi:hypothetical protein
MAVEPTEPRFSLQYTCVACMLIVVPWQVTCKMVCCSWLTDDAAVCSCSYQTRQVFSQ